MKGDQGVFNALAYWDCFVLFDWGDRITCVSFGIFGSGAGGR